MIRDGNVDVPPEVPNHLVLGDEETADDEQPSGSTDPQAAEHVPDDCHLDGFLVLSKSCYSQTEAMQIHQV